MAARTLADVLADVRFKLDRGSQYDAQIRAAIRNQINTLRGRRYGFNVKRAGIMLSGEYVTLPGEVLELDKLVLDRTTYREELEERNPHFIEEENTDPDWDGPPQYFSRERNISTKQIRLSPRADQSYSAQMVYLCDLVQAASLSNSWSDGIELAWFDDGFMLVQYATLVELERDVIGGPAGAAKAQAYGQALLAAEKELADLAGLEAHSGQVKGVM